MVPSACFPEDGQRGPEAGRRAGGRLLKVFSGEVAVAETRAQAEATENWTRSRCALAGEVPARAGELDLSI